MQMHLSTSRVKLMLLAMFTLVRGVREEHLASRRLIDDSKRKRLSTISICLHNLNFKPFIATKIEVIFLWYIGRVHAMSRHRLDRRFIETERPNTLNWPSFAPVALNTKPLHSLQWPKRVYNAIQSP